MPAPNTLPAPPPKFPLPDATTPAPLAPGEPEFDFTTLSPPLRAEPPNPHRRGPRRHVRRTHWGAPDPLDPALVPARPWEPLSDTASISGAPAAASARRSAIAAMARPCATRAPGSMPSSAAPR